MLKKGIYVTMLLSSLLLFTSCGENEAATMLPEADSSITTESIPSTQDLNITSGETRTPEHDPASQEDVATTKSSSKANLDLSNTYATKYGKIHTVDSDIFKFDYPDNWHITTEEYDNGFCSEYVVLSNDRGVTISYMASASSDFTSGYGRIMSRIKVKNVGKSQLVPSYPMGTDADMSYLGDFCVAKLKLTGELHMDFDEDYTKIDGATYYAVIPEFEVTTHEMVGTFINGEFSFPYVAPMSFVAESPNGSFTKAEQQEVVAIMSTFRIDNEYTQE